MTTNNTNEQNETNKKLTRYQYRCNVTGEVKSVSPQVYKKRMAQHGTDELGLRSIFVSSEGKRALRENPTLSLTEIHQKLGVVDADELTLPDEVIKEVRSKKMQSSQKKKTDNIEE